MACPRRSNTARTLRAARRRDRDASELLTALRSLDAVVARLHVRDEGFLVSAVAELDLLASRTTR